MSNGVGDHNLDPPDDNGERDAVDWAQENYDDIEEFIEIWSRLSRSWRSRFSESLDTTDLDYLWTEIKPPARRK